jgi:hypothetical protein
MLQKKIDRFSGMVKLQIEYEGEYFNLTDYDCLLLAPEFGKTINRTYMNEPNYLTRLVSL